VTTTDFTPRDSPLVGATPGKRVSGLPAPGGKIPQSVNADIAARLDEVADLLHHQGANPYRVDAYRHAATVLRRLAQPVGDLVRARGIEGLKQLPGVGDSIARSIYRILVSGRLPMLDRLRGESDPAELLATIPGIGRVYSERICEELGIEKLEELEIAAYDGRLAALKGIAGKRIAGIRESLAMRLGRVTQRPRSGDTRDVRVAEILDVDREYLAKAAKHLLPTIAPRRFNPKQERWLPVLHTSRGERHYTALFSNTGRAHQMGMTRDWVVIYYDGQAGERQCTVITSQRGPLQGKRIIRGREGECAAFYASAEGSPGARPRPEAGQKQ
jgi:hypothetical protein